LNFQALAQAAVKHLMLSLLPSFTATECILQMQQAVRQFGAALLRQHRILLTKTATALLGLTHCSRIMPNSVTVWCLLKSKSVKDLPLTHRYFLIHLFQQRLRLGLILMKMPQQILRLQMRLLPLSKMQSLTARLMMLRLISLRIRTMPLRSINLSSVVTVGLTISVSAVLTT
jgi:pyruv_ox_red: pyruvate:ferredoxin (flavodoxin) oxidoreductase